jgi:glycosyltransferase involved in cell wall biosynthesis
MNHSILFTTYHEAFLHKGGGEYELLDVSFALRKLGLLADIYSPFSKNLEHYDIIIHFSLEPSGLPLLELIKSKGKKIILWPNFWTASEFSSEQLALYTRFLALCDAVIFKSQAEYSILRPFIPVHCAVLHTMVGVDPCFSQPTPDRLFRDSYELEDYLLWVGIIEQGKNQLKTIKALQKCAMPLVFIGNYRDSNYYDQCLTAAPKHFVFLDAMPHKSDMLRAALQECSLYIELAYEPGGKSVLEAVISGAKVLLPESAWAREHFADFPTYIDPDNPESIKEGVQKALLKSIDRDFIAHIAKRHDFQAVLSPLYEYITHA